MAHMKLDEDKGIWYLADDWHIEDIQSVRADLDDDQAHQVLEAVADNFDANVGITWDVLEFWAHELFPAEV